MSINSDTSRSVREEAHQKLDALLYSISSRQLERVYGITPPPPPPPPKNQNSDAPSDAPLLAPCPSASTPAMDTAALSHPSGAKRLRERTPPTVRWEDELIDEKDDDDDKQFVPIARRLSFPPAGDFRKKLDLLKQKQKRDENLSAIAASMDDRLPGRDDGGGEESERERLVPYVDSLLNYVHYLESERAGYAGEMDKLRRNVAVAAKENGHLHKEIKRGFLEAVVVNASGVGEDENDAAAPEEADGAIEAMRIEIENLEQRHHLEMRRWKDKAESAERENEEMVKKMETLKEEEERRSEEWREKSDGGAEAKRIAKSLLNEKHELSNAVLEFSRKLTEAKTREEEVTNKLKKTLQVADQSLFEKDEMALIAEKTREELGEERQRWEEEKTKMEEEKSREIEKLNWETGSRIASLEAALGEAEGEAIKAKENMAAMERKRGGEEERWKKENKEDLEEAAVKRAGAGGNNIEKESENETHGNSCLKSSDVEFSRLKQTEARLRQEIVNYESKTRCLESELTEARDECVKLHERVAGVEREASLARLKRETMAKFRFEDAKEVREAADLEVEELRKIADDWKLKYLVDVKELKTFAGLQSDLISKLKEECVSLTTSSEATSTFLAAETLARSSESQQKDKLLADRSEQLQREKQKSKKLADSARKLKSDVFRLSSLAEERKAKILEMTDAVTKAIADRQMQAKENEFLRQIYLPVAAAPASQQFLLRSNSAVSTPASGRVGLDQLTPTPRLTTTTNLLMTAPGPSTVASAHFMPAVSPSITKSFSQDAHNP